MPNTIVTPQATLSDGRNYLSVVDFDIGSTPDGTPARVGSGVYLGNGIILTNAHNILVDGLGSVDTPIWAGQSIRASFAEGQEWAQFGGDVDLNSFIISDVNTFNYGQYRGNPAPSNIGDDLAVVQVDTSNLSAIPQNAMIIFSDPNEAVGNIWMAGYPNNNPSAEIMHETSGSLIGNDYVSIGDNNAWIVPGGSTFEAIGGQSGSGVWLTYDVNSDGISEQYLAGIFAGNVGSSDAFIEPLSDSYTELGLLLFGSQIGQLSLNPDHFETNVLIADQDGVQQLFNPNTGQFENIINNIVQGAGFNEDIYLYAGQDYVVYAGGNGVMGGDTVFYTGLTENVFATIRFDGIEVFKGNNGSAGRDFLFGVEQIEGTAQSDTFVIESFQLGNVITINGNSNVPIIPQGEPGHDTANAAGYGPQHMEDGTEDFLFIDQALRDAGAAITYMSDDGAGIVWIEEGGVTQRILYTGVFHLPQQDPDDFFWGSSGLGDIGAWVGIGDTGSVMVDLSGVTQDLDMSTFSGVSLWNLADDIVTGSGDVTLDLGFIGLDSFTGGSGDDTITGGATDDVFVGNLGNDSFFGNDGDDVLNGGGGADILDGGAGNDTASYEDSPNRVVINLLADTASSGHAAGDTLISIENLIGTEFGDNLRGNFGDNVINGGNGQDVLIGYNGDDMLFGGNADDAINGGAGADFIDGGAGFDQARYNGSTAAVQIDLGAGTAFGGSAQGDTLVNIEAVFGSLFNDMITGDAGNNYLYGSGGDDILAAGGGIDKFFGGSGADSFVLGEGFAYVTDFEDNIDQLDVSAYGFNSLNDALVNLDQVGDHARFRVGDDTLLVLFTDMNDLMDDIIFENGGV